MEQHVDQQLEQQSQIELLIAQGREQGYLILSEVQKNWWMLSRSKILFK